MTSDGPYGIDASAHLWPVDSPIRMHSDRALSCIMRALPAAAADAPNLRFFARISVRAMRLGIEQIGGYRAATRIEWLLSVISTQIRGANTTMVRRGLLTSCLRPASLHLGSARRP